LSPTELITSVQLELRRVGCLAALANGEWSATSQRSLTLFNKYAGTKFDAKLASVDALESVKAKPGRVCPLVCESGYRADGDRCVKITCRAGYELNDEGACEKIEPKKPTAKREGAKPGRERQERATTDSAPSKPQASGQIICNQQGCRPVRKGCRLGSGRIAYGSPNNAPTEACD
jgi:hypothetical protein